MRAHVNKRFRQKRVNEGLTGYTYDARVVWSFVCDIYVAGARNFGGRTHRRDEMAQFHFRLSVVASYTHATHAYMCIHMNGGSTLLPFCALQSLSDVCWGPLECCRRALFTHKQ